MAVDALFSRVPFMYGRMVVEYIREFWSHQMPKTKLTVSLSEELVEYLRSTSNASSVVAEAVSDYKARELEQRLEDAYKEDAKESESLNLEWESVDAGVEE